MKRCANLLLFCGTLSAATAQWDLPVGISLVADSADERQVLGVAAPTGETHGVSAGTERDGALTFVHVTGAQLLTGASLVPGGSFSPGQRLTIVADAVNSGDVSLSVDGLASIPLRKFVSEPLDSADLRPGIPVDVIYDGTVFQMISQLPATCPTGTAGVSRTVCMEVQPSPAANFFVAIEACGARNGRLCSFSEWIGACTMGNFVLTSITDYEWVDHAANYYDRAKTMGINANTLAPDCLSGSLRIPSFASPYRCCYDR